jgi:hypothetical protein
MSALTAQRRISNLIDGLLLPFDYPAKASTVFYKGGFVGLDATGYLVPMTATAGLRAAGAVDTGQAAKVDTTGQSDGDTVFKVQAGIWSANNHASDTVTQADMLKPVFFADDNTVARTDGGVGRPIAGIAVKIENGQVYTAVGFPFGLLDASQLGGAAPGPSNLVTSGALGLGRTTRVSVTGTVAFTLADGTEVGQRKSIRCTVAASTPVGVLTPAHASGFSTLTFGAVGNYAELEWNGTAWEIVATTATVA